MSNIEEYQTTRRYILQVMNEAGLQVENTLHELQARADPGAWARIEGYLKAGMLTIETPVANKPRNCMRTRVCPRISMPLAPGWIATRRSMIFCSPVSMPDLR